MNQKGVFVLAYLFSPADIPELEQAGAARLL